MFSEYLIKNKFYLKDSFKIECAKMIGLTPSLNHEWVQVGETISITSISNHQFTFIKDGCEYIYWCSVDIFTNLHCMTISEVRDLQINKILSE
jgi:hypothetical protein